MTTPVATIPPAKDMIQFAEFLNEKIGLTTDHSVIPRKPGHIVMGIRDENHRNKEHCLIAVNMNGKYCCQYKTPDHYNQRLNRKYDGIARTISNLLHKFHTEFERERIVCALALRADDEPPATEDDDKEEMQNFFTSSFVDALMDGSIEYDEKQKALKLEYCFVSPVNKKHYDIEMTFLADGVSVRKPPISTLMIKIQQTTNCNEGNHSVPLDGDKAMP
jgi:hypothetical protein